MKRHADLPMISGFPWWFCAAYLAVSCVFALVFVALGLWGGVFLALAMGGSLMVFRAILPAVYLGSSHLHIRRLGREVIIPLEQVAAVTETKQKWPFQSYAANISFANDTPFGRCLYLGGRVPTMIFPWAIERLKRAIGESEQTDLTKRWS